MAARELITSAFADVPYPGDDRITDHKDCEECEDIAAYFRGTDWRGHSLEKLWENHAAISLFTPEAFHYFLPAFMLATLEHPQEADLIPHSIAFQFTPPPPDATKESREHFSARLVRITPAQRQAVAAFLREYAATGELWADSALETLATLEG